MAVADDEVRPPSTAAAAGEEEAPGDAKDKKRRSSVLGALREAIGKVRFLLSFSATRWVLLASSAARGPARRLSFDARPAGLLEVEGSIVAPSPASSSSSSSSRTSRSTSLGTASARSLSRTSSAASPAAAAQMKRASSSASSGAASPAYDDDIDQRAEVFIANFYRQLRMERQVSLQLRYVRGNSWDRTP